MTIYTVILTYQNWVDIVGVYSNEADALKNADKLKGLVTINKIELDKTYDDVYNTWKGDVDPDKDWPIPLIDGPRIDG